MNDNEIPPAILGLIIALIFLFGFSMGHFVNYINHQNAIELGYFASPEEIQSLKSKKEQWIKEQESKRNQPEKYGITD